MRKAASAIVVITLAAIIMLLLALFSATPAHAEQSWSVQIVDANAEARGNGYAPIEVDSNNITHIGYSGRSTLVNSTLMGLGYATLNSSNWIIQESPFGRITDLKLDSNDNPHMLLGSRTYALWTGTEWYTQTIPSTEGSVYASLALDSSDNPHVAYTYGDGLKYANWTGTSWNIQTVDASYSEIGFQLSLLLDKNNVPYILYANSSRYQDSGRNYDLVMVKLAVLKDTEWSIEPVLASYKFSGCWNMVLDSNGYPRFLATVPQPPTYNSTILYVSWNGFGWNTQTVVSDVDLSSRGFLALDAYDNPSIVYAENDKVLMYAAWTGREWNIQTVDTNIPTVAWTGTEWAVQSGTSAPLLLIDGPCYLALDSNRIPHISYRVGLIGGSSKTTIIRYAVASEPTPLYSPLPLQLVLTAVAIGAAVFVVYLWKKKT